MNAHDHHDPTDALGRRAATALRDEVERRLDVDAALARVLDGERAASLLVRTQPGDPAGLRSRRSWLAAAAAVLVVGGAGVAVLVNGRDAGSRVVPADSTAPEVTDGVATTPASTPDTTSTPQPAPTTPTTAPSNSAPSNTAPSTAATPSPAPTVTTIRVPVASDVDALAGLVAPSTIVAVEVPAYLPPTPVADPTEVRLTQYDQQAETDTATQLVQTWATEDGRVIELSTRLGGVGAPTYGEADAVPTDVSPWDDAVVDATMAEGYAQIHLRDPSGTVTMWASGFTSDELLSIAARMTLSPEGWRLPVDETPGVVETHSGWRRAEFATRVLQWDTGTEQGELIVSLGMPETIRTGFFGVGTPSTLDDVNGAPAMVSRPGSGTTVTWSPAPDVVLVLGFTGSAEETLALARSLVLVDEATWGAAGVLDTSEADGCNSYFFC